MRTWVALFAAGAVLLYGCGNGQGNAAAGAGSTADAAGVGNSPGAATRAAGIDFSSPESVLAAYSDATDTGDIEVLKQVLRPSQRDMVGGATGVPEAQRGHTIVRRENRSASEVWLQVRFKARSDVMPHVLVLEEGKWYLDIEKTTEAMLAAGD